MKYVLQLIFFIIFIMPCFSQNSIEPSIVDTEEIIAENAFYKSEINKLNAIIMKNEKIIDENNVNIHLLDSVIDYQNKIFNSSGHWIDLMAIFLTILSIGLPLLTYLFGIKPSREQIRQNKDFVKKFLQQKEEDEINYCLNALSSKNIAEKNRALIVLNSYVNHTFSSRQMGKLIKMAKFENDNENLKQTINSILSLNYSKMTEEYFIDLLTSGEVVDFYYIDRFFLLAGFENYFIYIAKRCKEDVKTLYNILIYLKSLSHSAVIQLLNDKDIISACGEKIMEIKPLIDNVINTDVNVQGTLFYEETRNIEGERKKQQEQEEKQKQQKENERRLSKTDIVKLSGYRWDGENVIDKDGQIIEQIDFVYSVFSGGMRKVQKGVEFNGEIIPLNEIKKNQQE